MAAAAAAEGEPGGDIGAGSGSEGDEEEPSQQEADVAYLVKHGIWKQEKGLLRRRGGPQFGGRRNNFKETVEQWQKRVC